MGGTYRRAAYRFRNLYLIFNNDGGDIIKVPIGDNQHFLIEYRDTDAAYYDRGLANSGVLIWHINEAECFDGFNTDNADEWNPCPINTSR